MTLVSPKALIRLFCRKLGYELIAIQSGLPKDIRQDYESVLSHLDGYSFKFLDLKTFLPIYLRRAHSLQLHKTTGLHILDIGCGTGLFQFVCEYYGHTTTGLDRPGNQVFEDTCKWIKVKRVVHEIRAYEKLPNLHQEYDLVTAFMVNFDRFPENHYKPWGPNEWQYFLFDLAHFVKPTGRIVLSLNGHTLAQTTVLDSLRQLGAFITGPTVIFDAPQQLLRPCFTDNNT